MNLWILSEEYPRVKTLETIIKIFLKDYNFSSFIDNIRVIPILENNSFNFTYKVIGINCNKIENIFIKISKGSSSFVDYLIFYQYNEPNHYDNPIYAIEETKTDDKESRNTSIYQRAIKFIFVDAYYKNVKKVMLHQRQNINRKFTDTYIFGVKLLKTFNVFFTDEETNKIIPFSNIDELITFKNNMRKPPKDNTPITITKINNNLIEISGILKKADSLSHDPNIGALTAISYALRKLGWKYNIIITKHKLEQRHIKRSKFVQIANDLNIGLDKLYIPKVELDNLYWHYDREGEKLATIFVHVIVESFTNGHSIFENHAGCEKGYFITSENEYIPLEKYVNREDYKSGNKTAKLNIPDLILIDVNKLEIINIEGKKITNLKEGLKSLEEYYKIEGMYIKKYYPKYKIIRTLVIYGGNEKDIKQEIKIGFLLSKDGNILLGIEAPHLFKLAVKNLLDFWRN